MYLFERIYSIFIESILLLEGYVCFSKISVALYLHQYDICKLKPTLSFITLVPKFILYYPQMWGIALAWAHCSQHQNKKDLFRNR